MTPRARWLIRWLGSAIVWSVAAVAFAIADEPAAAIIATGAAATGVLQTAASISLYRAGFFQGRGSELVDEQRRRLGLPVSPPTVDDVQPWDEFPAWPSDLDHTPKNMV
jgi:hypothetical protein